MNVTALVNTSGTVVERVLYDPYGQPTFYDGSWENPSASSAYANEVLFTGHRLDAETGLYYAGARYYHPTLGRFFGRDKSGYVDGFNLHEYALSAPVVVVDPYGLDSWTDRRNAVPRTPQAKNSVKYHLADVGARIEGRRAELTPMWDAFDNLTGFKCDGGAPAVAVTESYANEVYDYNLIRSKLTKTEEIKTFTLKVWKTKDPDSSPWTGRSNPLRSR